MAMRSSSGLRWREATHLAMVDPAARNPDTCARVVAHFDVDCFYAQAELLRRPSLRERPVGITQKFLVVTCNYVARGLGVPKMVPIEEAKRKLILVAPPCLLCPDLVLINGEDLTPYRAASKRIMALLGRFGTVERLGLDEGAVDITTEVRARVTSGTTANVFSGLVIDLGTISSKQSQPMIGSRCLDNIQEGENIDDRKGQEERLELKEGGGDKLLMVGSQLVSEIRTALEKETGFQVSCGIAHNKMLAKMACSVNKPNKQTVLLSSAVSDFLASMSVRKLPGVGHQMQGVLKEIGVDTVADLRNVTMGRLSSMFGERIGVFMYHACRGYDPKPVQDKGPPKSLSVEDSFRYCVTLQQVEDIMRVLAPDLVRRLDEDKAETGRTPKLLTVKWRTKAIMPFTSVSGPMPADVLLATLPLDRRREAAVEAGMRLVSRYFGTKPFHMVVLNIGAAGFTEYLSGTTTAGDIRQFLRTPGNGGSGSTAMKFPCSESTHINEGLTHRGSPQKEINKPGEAVKESTQARVPTNLLKVVSKSEARTSREGHYMEEASPSYSELLRSHGTGLTYEGRGAFTSDLSDYSDDDEGEAAWVDEGISSLGWNNVGKGFSGQVRDQKFLNELQTAECLREPTADNSCGSKADSRYEGETCKQCGQVVEGSEQGRQEHEDYHFALSLQENNAGIKSTQVATCGPAGTNSSRVRSDSPNSPSLKRPRARNGTLDGFVVRRST